VDELAELNVSHVTITVNAVDPAVSAEIYAWVRHNKRVFNAQRGTELLLMNQFDAIQKLKACDMVVKVNAVLIPGINDEHIGQIAKQMATLNVDIFNCVPYYQNAGSAFEHLPSPSPEMVQKARAEAAKFLPQMHHCTRCRADAVGLLGKDNSAFMQLLQEIETQPEPPPASMKSIPVDSSRPYIAVASMEGMLINQHLGEAERLLIYKQIQSGMELLEARKTPQRGDGLQRWKHLADMLGDCQSLLVSGIGNNPRQVLTKKGLQVHVLEGVIEEAVSALFAKQSINHLMKRERTACGAECSGGGGGCG
jgi:nitrogen fixation protein NifB